MVIRVSDLHGVPSNSKPKKPVPTPEQRAALELIREIDSGMTLTRFQVEAASLRDGDESWTDVDNLIKTAVFALSHVETTDTDTEKVTALAIALEAIALAVDQLDTDLEDVANEVLNDLR